MRFLGTDKKEVDYAENQRRGPREDDARAGVFFKPSRHANARSRAKLLARLDATEHARVETPRFRRRLFFSQK